MKFHEYNLFFSRDRKRLASILQFSQNFPDPFLQIKLTNKKTSEKKFTKTPHFNVLSYENINKWFFDFGKCTSSDALPEGCLALGSFAKVKSLVIEYENFVKGDSGAIQQGINQMIKLAGLTGLQKLYFIGETIDEKNLSDILNNLPNLTCFGHLPIFGSSPYIPAKHIKVISDSPFSSKYTNLLFCRESDCHIPYFMFKHLHNLRTITIIEVQNQNFSREIKLLDRLLPNLKKLGIYSNFHSNSHIKDRLQQEIWWQQKIEVFDVLSNCKLNFLIRGLLDSAMVSLFKECLPSSLFSSTENNEESLYSLLINFLRREIYE